MVVIYARQSLDRDGTGAAVDRQLEECRAQAERLGLTVSHEYVDNDTSATKGIRPAFQRLLTSIEQGEVDTVIVWATDRLYRRLRDLVNLVELAETHRLSILTVKSGDLDLGTPAGRMLAGMLGSAARYEVEQKGARQVAANAQRSRAGEWQFSRRPFGYERVGKQVVQVPAEVEVIREGYERSLAGESGYSIVADWNARAVPAPGGGAWSITQLRNRLANPGYAGLVVHQGEIVGEGTHEPVVSREDYEAFVQGVKQRRDRRTHDNRVKYLGSGLYLCGVCGAKLFARPEYRRAGGKIMTYQCTSCWGVSRSLGRVDALVEAVLLTRLSRPDALELLTPEVDIKPIVAEIDSVRERLDDLAALLGEGVLTASAVREQSAKLRARQDELSRQVAAATPTGSLASLLTADDVRARWADLDIAVRRSLLRSLVQVTIKTQGNPRIFDPEAVVIEWLS